MANVAKNAILRAKIAGQITDIMVKTTTSQVYVNDTTTLAAHLETLAAKATLEQLQQTVANLGALAQKDKVSYADLEEALAALIDGKAEASALTEEIARAKAAEEANAAAAAAAQAAADKAQGGVDTLVGTDTGKSVRTIANEELAKQLIPENAAESLNELQEIAAWIQNHPGDAAAMNAAIAALQAKVVLGTDAEGTEYATVKAYVEAAIAALKIGDYAKAADLTELAGRVTTAEGKITALEETAAGLGDLAVKDVVSEGDLDEALAEKVNASAQANHSHANKDVLDGISAETVTAWNNKGNIYYSATEPANLTENDLWVALID